MMKKTLNWLFDYPNLKVYQYEEGFKFSLDSILLFEFAQIKKEVLQQKQMAKAWRQPML